MSNAVAFGPSQANLEDISLSASLEDMDGDGASDLVLTNGGTGASATFRGDGGQRFRSEVGASGLSYSAELKDLDQDGLLDLAISIDQTGAAALLLGDGAGEFQLVSGRSSPAPGFALTGSLTDLNSDGIPDLVLTNDDSGVSHSFRGDGAGRFSAPATADRPGYSAELVDLNKDGLIDLSVSNEHTGAVALLEGDGTGRFNAVTREPAVGSAPALSVAFGEIDAGGRPRLMTMVDGRSGARVELALDGDQRFTRDDLIEGHSTSVRFVDANKDGIGDLVLRNEQTLAVALLLGEGAGHYTPYWSDLPDAGAFNTAATLSPELAGSEVQRDNPS